MPTYQYACTNPECGNRFELVQSFSDPAATDCPLCAQSVRKVYGSVGVVFKGSGFYRTDSRASANGKTGGKSATTSDTSTSTSGDGANAAPKSTASNGTGSATSGSAGASKAAAS